MRVVQLTDWPRVESIVDQVFQVLAHPYLSHQLVLIAIHSGQLSHVSEDILESVGQLKTKSHTSNRIKQSNALNQPDRHPRCSGDIGHEHPPLASSDEEFRDKDGRRFRNETSFAPSL
jgi:hypothetical protein